MAISRRDKYTQQATYKEVFSDFMMNLDMNPDTKDLYRNINLYAIQSSLKSLILTNRGERLFQPDVGSDIRAQLFELYETQTVEVLKQYVKSTIENYEPRVKYVDCSVIPSEDSNGLFMSVYFSTVQAPGQIESITVFLTRAR